MVMGAAATQPDRIRAIYDSGWFAVNANSNYTKAHGLGAKPHISVVMSASDNTGSDCGFEAYRNAGSGDYGSTLDAVTTTQYSFHTLNSPDNRGFGSWNGAYARILLLLLNNI
jgi:hypothetical protein